MSGYNEGQIIKTARDNDVGVKVVDGQSGSTATRKLTIAEDADALVAGTNDFGIIPLGKSSDGKLRALKTDSAGNLMTVPGVPSGSATVVDAYTHTAVAGAGSDNHDKVITTGKTVNALRATCASEGLFKYQIGLWDGTTFTPYAVGISSPASPTIQISNISQPLGDGTKAIRVIATNLDTNANDAFTTIEFVEE